MKTKVTKPRKGRAQKVEEARAAGTAAAREVPAGARSISIRELHMRTGHFVREAAQEPLVVTDRGRVVARLMPPHSSGQPIPFPKRRLSTLPEVDVDSTDLISDDRDRP